MRLLIGIKSCMRDWMDGAHEAIRDTWGRFLPPNVDLRFFYGNGAGWMLAPSHDEIFLDVADSYLDLAFKTKAMANWSLSQGYDFSYFADNDTFVHPEHLVSSGFENYKFSAPVHILAKPTPDHNYPWGGFGYFIDRESAEILAAADVGDFTAEDAWVGRRLFEAGIPLGGPLPKFSWHFPRDMYPSSVYNSKFPWQQMMMEHHLLKQPSPERFWDTPIGVPPRFRKVSCVLNGGDKAE